MERLRAVTGGFFARHPMGPSSAPLMDSHGRLLRRVTDRQEGNVAFKDTVIRVVQRSLPGFDYSESTSWAAGGVFDFTRRNPSGTRDWITFTRDKYGGAFGLDAAACAFPCPPVYLNMAGDDPMETVNPGWGIRGLADLMNHGAADAAWTWIYKDQPSLEAGLREATERASRTLLPLFAELEPVLVDMRSLGRQ